jgi:hypothetical protein
VKRLRSHFIRDRNRKRLPEALFFKGYILTKKEFMAGLDIDKERETVTSTEMIDYLDLVFDGELTPQEFLNHIKKQLSKLPAEALLRFEIGEWDNPDEIEIIRKSSRPETDEEVIKRLYDNYKAIRKEEREIQKAKKLLKEKGISWQ